MLYMRSKNPRSQCPVAGKQLFSAHEFIIFCLNLTTYHFFLASGCPKLLQAEKLVCDPLLLFEIDEMRTMSNQTARTDVIEDCTELDEEGND